MCGNVPVYKMKYKNSLFQLFVLDSPFQSITDVVNRMFYREKKNTLTGDLCKKKLFCNFFLKTTKIKKF